jgi:hypothetical protein
MPDAEPFDLVPDAFGDVSIPPHDGEPTIRHADLGSDGPLSAATATTDAG